MQRDIDIVIPWVDGNDIEWIKEKEKYQVNVSGDNRKNRYRDWDNLQYSFRAIEKFLPWVRKVHFVTWGHLPTWLNVNHPKLNVVTHQDYIPKEYLPVFSANPIEMNLHRIEDLSEKFIYMNDDMFFLKPVREEEFFVEGLPCDTALESVHQFKKGGIDHIVANDLEILNEHFNKRECIKLNKNKFYSLKYGKGCLKNIYLAPFGYFTGFENPHMPVPFLKSVLEEIWRKEPKVLEGTSKNKFRSVTDVNQWLIRYWQFASGKFVPINKTQSRFFSIGRDDEAIKNAILNQQYKMICLSDDDEMLDFEREKEFIKQCFEEILSDKSSFEL